MSLLAHRRARFLLKSATSDLQKQQVAQKSRSRTGHNRVLQGQRAVCTLLGARAVHSWHVGLYIKFQSSGCLFYRCVVSTAPGRNAPAHRTGSSLGRRLVQTEVGIQPLKASLRAGSLAKHLPVSLGTTWRAVRWNYFGLFFSSLFNYDGAEGACLRCGLDCAKR